MSYRKFTTLLDKNLTFWHCNETILHPHSFNPFFRITGKHAIDSNCNEKKSYRLKAMVKDLNNDKLSNFLILNGLKILIFDIEKKKVIKEINPKLEDEINKGGLGRGKSKYEELSSIIYHSESNIMVAAFDKMVKAHWAFVIVFDLKPKSGVFTRKKNYILKEFSCGGWDEKDLMFHSFGSMFITPDGKKLVISDLEVVVTKRKFLILNFEKKSPNFLNKITSSSFPFPVQGEPKWLQNGYFLMRSNMAPVTLMRLRSDGAIMEKAVCNQLIGSSKEYILIDFFRIFKGLFCIWEQILCV